MAADDQLVFPPLIWIQGEMGQSKLNTFKTVEDAVKDFEKKFKDKTKNSWSDRENFSPQPGKYTLIEVDGDEDAEVKVTRSRLQSELRAKNVKIKASGSQRLMESVE